MALKYNIYMSNGIMYHGHMAVIGYGKYLILPFLIPLDGISGSFGLAIGIG